MSYGFVTTEEETPPTEKQEAAAVVTNKKPKVQVTFDPEHKAKVQNVHWLMYPQLVYQHSFSLYNIWV